MTIVEYTKDNIGALMYDGFIPVKDKLASIIITLYRSETITKEEYQSLVHNFDAKIKSTNSYFYMYNKLQYYFMTRGECPSRKHNIPFYTALGDKIGYIHCFSQYYTTGNNKHSLELKSKRYLEKLKSSDSYPILRKEYSNTRSIYPEERYMQNVIIRANNVNCKGLSKCINDVVNSLSFRIKEDDTYINLNAFNNSWMAMLHNIIVKYKHLYFTS